MTSLASVCPSVQWERERQMLTPHDSSASLNVFVLALPHSEQPPEDMVKDEEIEAHVQAHTTKKGTR